MIQRMRHFACLLLFFSSISITFSQNSEDCVDARPLAPTTPILLSDLAPIVIDSVVGAGTESAEWFVDDEMGCGPGRLFVANDDDKSFWFVFSAETSGTMELLITPEDFGTSYEFALWRGGCPNDATCGELFYCNYTGISVCDGAFKPVGVSTDPINKFGYDPLADLNLFVYNESISLEAGENYYLLVQNTNKARNSTCPTPLDNDSLGFTIQFDGTATVGPEILHQDPTPILPTPVTDRLFRCEGDVQTFAVSQVEFATTYDWMSKSTMPGSTITPNALGDSVSVQFGPTSGQICMEMICPVQSLICWDVSIDIVPDLVAIPNALPACEPVDLNTRYQDNNNVPSPTVNFFETEQDALDDTNPLSSSIVSVAGPYWVKETTPNGCSDIVRIDILLDLIDFSVVDTLKFCSTTTTFANLNDELTITNLNVAGGDLSYFYYEDSLDAVNSVNPVNTQAVFQDDTFWIRAEKQSGGQCYRIKKLEFLIETSPNIAAIDDLEFCGGDCFQVANLDLVDANGLQLSTLNLSFYPTEAAAELGNVGDVITEICNSGTYWVRGASSLSCYSVEPFRITLYPAPSVDDFSMNLDCVFGCLDLTDLTLIEKNGIPEGSLSYDFYASLGEAEDVSAAPLADLNICMPSDVWVRATNTDNGCFDVAELSVVGMTLATATTSGDEVICKGDDVTIRLDFIGDAPFNFSYTDGVNNVDTLSSTSTFNFTVSPEMTTTYTLTNLVDGNGCAGNIGASAMVTVNEGANISMPSFDCTTAAIEYRLTFDILGTGHYQLQGIKGTLTGNTFVSDLIASGSAFNFQVLSDDGCDPLDIPIAFSCQCNSTVDVMDVQPKNICDQEPAEGIYLGPSGESLDKEDIRYFVLHDSPTAILGNVIAFKENISTFNFDPNTMQHGVTYYISPVITKADMMGNPILNSTSNPCIAISEGAPVTFFPVPEVAISLSNSTLCKGDITYLNFDIEGVGPYDVVFLEGNRTINLTSISDGHRFEVNATESTIFYIQSITQSGMPTCAVTPMQAETEVELTVIDVPTIINSETICNEEGSKLVLTFELEGGLVDNYALANGSNITGSFKGTVFTSDSILHNIPYTAIFEDANQCGVATVSGIAECLCTSDITVGIDMIKSVSCSGEKDAILVARPTNGVAPFSFLWSTGDLTERVNNIAAGNTYVSMTDSNGCVRVDSISLIEPRSLTSSINTLAPSCYGENDGAVIVVQTQGGTQPYKYSFGGSSFNDNSILDNLGEGIYAIFVKDENGCEWLDTVTLENPPELAVSLPRNIDLKLGESIDLIPLVNQNIIATTWESLDTSICLDCPNLVVSPTESTSYTVNVMNESGCLASDQVIVRVESNNLVYVPSAFSPNGDGSNDLLRPYSSVAVQEINMFRVFNRWGELIYENVDMDMVSNLEGWNGNTMSGRKAPPGVYLYFAEVSFKNGTKTMLSGDVSLVR